MACGSIQYVDNPPDICLQLELSLLKRMFFKRKACEETQTQYTVCNVLHKYCLSTLCPHRLCIISLYDT